MNFCFSLYENMRWNGLCLALDLAVNEPAQYCKTCPITQEVIN